jgi:hypothetical protein
VMVGWHGRVDPKIEVDRCDARTAGAVRPAATAGDSVGEERMPHPVDGGLYVMFITADTDTTKARSIMTSLDENCTNFDDVAAARPHFRGSVHVEPTTV